MPYKNIARIILNSINLTIITAFFYEDWIKHDFTKSLKFECKIESLESGCVNAIELWEMETEIVDCTMADGIWSTYHAHHIDLPLPSRLILRVFAVYTWALSKNSFYASLSNDAKTTKVFQLVHNKLRSCYFSMLTAKNPPK